MLASTAAANAVLQYAAALTRASSSDDVEMPTVDAGGCMYHERLRIKPTSRLRAVWAAADELEDGDASFVEDLNRRREAILAVIDAPDAPAHLRRVPSF
jgi:hypothetical protein